jgi:hypothetical protein
VDIKHDTRLQCDSPHRNQRLGKHWIKPDRLIGAAYGSIFEVNGTVLHPEVSALVSNIPICTAVATRSAYWLTLNRCLRVVQIKGKDLVPIQSNELFEDIAIPDGACTLSTIFSSACATSRRTCAPLIG